VGLPKDITRTNPTVGDWCILAGYVGSISHGTYRPNTEANSIDDKDVMALFVPPLDYYIGADDHGVGKGTVEIKRNEWDIVCYEARKAVGLLAQGNPNVLAILWLRDNDYIVRSEAGDYLVGERGAFVGRHVYRPFIGYAYSQLRKMENYSFYGYMGEKRKRLVEKHGYDTKNASHLIRLLTMGCEFLVDGELYVYREDAQRYLDIKDGKWTLTQVKDEAYRLFERAEELYDKSTLPKGPDYEEINTICENVIRLKLGLER